MAAARAGGRNAAPGPATTLTMVMLVWPRAYVVHVGDSRAFYLRKGRLRQLTRDQTTGEYMVDCRRLDRRAGRARRRWAARWRARWAGTR